MKLKYWQRDGYTKFLFVLKKLWQIDNNLQRDLLLLHLDNQLNPKYSRLQQIKLGDMATL